MAGFDDGSSLPTADDAPDDTRVALARLLGVTRHAIDRNAQLQAALDARIVIEQAKGVLSERLRIDLDDAFELIDRCARAERIEPQHVAAKVVSSRETPPELQALLA